MVNKTIEALRDIKIRYKLAKLRSDAWAMNLIKNKIAIVLSNSFLSLILLWYKQIIAKNKKLRAAR